MFIERRIYPELKEHLSAKQITVITGMRSTGKTTLLKKLLEDIPSENKTYLDLEKLENRFLFSEANYDNVLRKLEERGLDFSKKAYVAIDEMQLVPNIPSVLKYLYDHYDIKFLVSGSSSYYLKNLFSESMAGRKRIFELYPLDFGEFLRFKGLFSKAGDFRGRSFSESEYLRLGSYYEEYVNYGGFPEVALASDIGKKKELLSDVVSSYLNVDVKSLSDFTNAKNIYNLIKMLAGRMCTRLDYSKISRISGLSRPTVMNYAELFEKTYLIFRVPVHSKHPDREIVKAQKLYFCDNGVANLLYPQSGGSLFENAVFNQLRAFGKIGYYSLKTGREIDFVLNGSAAFEAKESPTQSDLNGLEDLSAKAGLGKFRLIGRNKVPGFTDYTWGGDIR